MNFSWKTPRLFFLSLGQLIYPQICWLCQKLQPPDGQPICSECLAQATLDPHQTCERCSSTVGPHVDTSAGCLACRDQSFGFERAFRMGPYQGLLREAILRMKFAPGEGLAELLATHWAERMGPRLQPFHPDLVIPVPLHWRRRWQRGFNSNEIFAQALAQRLGIRTVPSWLYRCRPTAQQAGQTSLSARQENVRDAFRARGHEGLQGKTVLLIDDVLTTGATASAAARALKALKPGKILVAVLGHGR